MTWPVDHRNNSFTFSLTHTLTHSHTIIHLHTHKVFKTLTDKYMTYQACETLIALTQTHTCLQIPRALANKLEISANLLRIIQFPYNLIASVIPCIIPISIKLARIQTKRTRHERCRP